MQVLLKGLVNSFSRKIRICIHQLTYPLPYVSASTGYFVMSARQIAVYSAEVGYSVTAYTRCESASPISVLTLFVMTFFSMYCVVAREKTCGMAPSIQDGFLIPDDWGVGITCNVGEKVGLVIPWTNEANTRRIPYATYGLGGSIGWKQLLKFLSVSQRRHQFSEFSLAKLKKRLSIYSVCTKTL